MLRELFIHNFAIIDDLRVQFEDGLTVLSGETGAGKSIIINAVNLILGSRASSKLIRNGEKSAELEAFFDVGDRHETAKLMKVHGFDPSEGLIVRRVISSNDRHKIYINGRLSTLDILSKITENLASISGQHAHQSLLKEDQHLTILDEFTGLMSDREMVCSLYNEVLSEVRKLNGLIRKKGQKEEQLELMSFQRDEIDQANILEDEDEVLEKEKTKLKHAELLYKAAYGSMETLYNSNGAVHETLNDVIGSMEKASMIDPEFEVITNNTRQIIYHIEDVNDQLIRYAKQIEMDDNRLEEIDDRLNLLNQMKRKYGKTLKDIAQYRMGLEDTLSEKENLDKAIELMKNDLSALHLKLCNAAGSLSEKRHIAAERISLQVEEQLKALGMPHTLFEVMLQPQPVKGDKESDYLKMDGMLIHEWGVDNAVFMIAPNVGEATKPLSAIASGGELSRIVLALKVILTENDAIGTVVFDEVDAGIGGGIAEVVGKKITELSHHHQVICITHLPQIAKFGDHHYKIEKQVLNGRTTTSMEVLDEEKRIEEIARMLGGVKITNATLDHAREMLGVDRDHLSY